jgi:hypothetical protein
LGTIKSTKRVKWKMLHYLTLKIMKNLTQRSRKNFGTQTTVLQIEAQQSLTAHQENSVFPKIRTLPEVLIIQEMIVKKNRRPVIIRTINFLMLC